MPVEKCGCGSVVTVDHGPGLSERVGDDRLRGLNPVDGLFLRAEHLSQMQAYAREYALVAGVAAGAGVDYGYQVDIDGGAVCVSAGLAVDATRRPLRSSTAVRLPLGGLPELGEDEFWRVEVLGSRPVPSGSEPLYGSVCDEPCGDSTIRPWLDESVEIRLVRDNLHQLGGGTDRTKRNTLASLYFDRERRGQDPWLTPSSPHGPIGPITRRAWRAPDPKHAPQPAPVALAVVFRANDEWVVDTWTARRDIGGPPARGSWEGHLGQRPWNIFVAHVLQFQAQLVDALAGGDRGRICLSREELERLATDLATPGILEEGEEGERGSRAAIFELLSRSGGYAAGATLPELGFLELPPAGILPAPPTPLSPDYVDALFGETCEVSIRECRADCALDALLAAQHLDRIPLTPGANTKPAVTLFVPTTTTCDLPATTPGADYPWMMFARTCPDTPVVDAKPDKEQVLPILIDKGDAIEANRSRLEAELRGHIHGHDVHQVGVVRYTDRDSADPFYCEIPSNVTDQLFEGAENLGFIAVGFFHDEPRRLLAWTRAAQVAGLVGSMPMAAWQKQQYATRAVREDPERGGIERVVLVRGRFEE